MHSDFDDGDFPLNFEALLGDSVAYILTDEDPGRFLAWLREHIGDYDDSPGSQLARHPEASAALALALGRVIWNAMPLPGNNYRPRPMAEPQRNASCPCGSGRKYKQCCVNAPQFPPMEHGALWPLVLAQLPGSTVDDLVAKHRLPIQALLAISETYIGDDQPRKAARLLEPLFVAPIAKTDELYDFALNLLCNVYDDLGFNNKKLKLLDSVIAEKQRSPLRAGAWQRLATIRLDNGDVEGAWEAFRHAQRDDPDALGIGVLEVQLLVTTNQVDQAQARAQFWVRRMRRHGMELDDSPLDFMLAVAEDPIQAMAGVGMGITGDAGQRLQTWLQAVDQRPVPVYQVLGQTESLGGGNVGDATTVLTGRLLEMGLSEAQVDQALLDLAIEFAGGFDNGEGDNDELFLDETQTLALTPPEAVLALEVQWREYFSLEKPLSVHDEPFDGEDVWDIDEEEVWMTFLEQHPEAFDSLEILDDVATACVLHPQHATRWLDDVLLAPLLKRSEAIAGTALEGVAAPRLMWGCLENRPVLRSLARLVALHRRSGHTGAAQRVMDQLLALNPEDNHGFRLVLMNERLRSGDDGAALELANRYPDDLNAELLYGRVLALFRLESLGEARSAVLEAVERLPKVVRYLSHKRVRQPKLNPDSYAMGGDDQAWYYRQEMRDVWQATPGALEWLKKQAKQVAGT